MGCAGLQFVQNGVADALGVAPLMRVPEPQCFNAARLQKRLAHRVMLLLIWKTMLTAVQFNVQPSLLAKEIQIVNANGMLPPEFVAVEAPVPQPAPDEFFRPCFLNAEMACAIYVGHKRKLAKEKGLRKLVFGSPST